MPTWTPSKHCPGATSTRLNLLVTGGCGYKGSVLIPLLLDGPNVTSIDTVIWQCSPRTSPADQSEAGRAGNRSDTYAGIDAVIHLANIANDPAVELNPTLSWEVNVLAGQQLADRAVRAGVKQFLFANSGSVYGRRTNPA